mgnify:CR=1 FL=1
MLSKLHHTLVLFQKTTTSKLSVWVRSGALILFGQSFCRMNDSWRNIGRHSSAQNHSLSSDCKFQFSLYQVGPLFMWMTMRRQIFAWFDWKMAKRGLIRSICCQRQGKHGFVPFHPNSLNPHSTVHLSWRSWHRWNLLLQTSASDLSGQIPLESLSGGPGGRCNG